MWREGGLIRLSKITYYLLVALRNILNKCYVGEGLLWYIPFECFMSYIFYDRSQIDFELFKHFINKFFNTFLSNFETQFKFT